VGIDGGWANSKKDVNSMRNDLQMLGIDAASIPEKMIDRETSRHGLACQPKRESVSHF
jgi:hypothetical protein